MHTHNDVFLGDTTPCEEEGLEQILLVMCGHVCICSAQFKKRDNSKIVVPAHFGKNQIEYRCAKFEFLNCAEQFQNCLYAFLELGPYWNS